MALDINPNAARSALDNAAANGLGDRITAVCSNLLSALAPRPQFDVILSNPPYFPGEPLDLADRAWNAGPAYRDIAPLFEQARAALEPGGSMYLLISSECDFGTARPLIERAGFRPRPVQEYSIVIDVVPHLTSCVPKRRNGRRCPISRFATSRWSTTRPPAGVPGVENVSFEIEASEFLCLVGPSGCGKTTLLNIIAGFLAPTAGEICIGGKAVTGHGMDRGIVFQDFAQLFPWRTALGNVDLRS